MITWGARVWVASNTNSPRPMNLPPLNRLGTPVCPPCTPTDVSVHELLLLAQERDRLKAEHELALQLQRASLQGGEADAEPPALPSAGSSIDCAICLGSLLKGSNDAPYPPQSLANGAWGRPYVTVCANGHLVHKECIKRHLANDNRNIGRSCPECREDIFTGLDLDLYPKEDSQRVQRDLWKYVQEKKPDAVRYLLAVGANPNAFRSAGGYNALLFAAQAGDLGVVRALLDDPRTNLRLVGSGSEQRADEIAKEERGENDPVYKLLAEELAKVERGERLPGDQSFPRFDETLGDGRRHRWSWPRSAPPLDEDAASDFARREAAAEREQLGLGPFTHYLVKMAVEEWLAGEDGNAVFQYLDAMWARGGGDPREPLTTVQVGQLLGDLIRRDIAEHGLDKFEDLDRVQERVVPMLLREGFAYDEIDVSISLRRAIDDKIRRSPEYLAAVDVAMRTPGALRLWGRGANFFSQQRRIVLMRVQNSVVEYIMAGALARVARVWYLMGIGRGEGLNTEQLERRLAVSTMEYRRLLALGGQPPPPPGGSLDLDSVSGVVRVPFAVRASPTYRPLHPAAADDDGGTSLSQD